MSEGRDEWAGDGETAIPSQAISVRQDILAGHLPFKLSPSLDRTGPMASYNPFPRLPAFTAFFRAFRYWLAFIIPPEHPVVIQDLLARRNGYKLDLLRHNERIAHVSVPTTFKIVILSSITLIDNLSYLFRPRLE
jgi:hypothetical protein